MCHNLQTGMPERRIPMLVIIALGLLHLVAMAVPSSSAGTASDGHLLPYTPAQEVELARLRYTALLAEGLQRTADYLPATEAELARLRYDAMQAQWHEREAHIDCSAAEELTLAQQRYALLRAQRPDLYDGQ
jgi:hypothetical protein